MARKFDLTEQQVVEVRFWLAAMKQKGLTKKQMGVKHCHAAAIIRGNVRPGRELYNRLSFRYQQEVMK